MITTLGEFIEALEALDGDEHIEFSFDGVYPESFSSYRGYYKDIALTFTVGYGNNTTVSELLQKAREAVGKTYEGWKGGDFTMDKNTTLWVANDGECDGLQISGIKKGEYKYIIDVVKTD